MAEPAYQSLYRRYRPQRFDEVRGQDHVTKALRNALREGRVSHAYLFSGPRGTGKTSTARILAKALNCTDLQDGEPCCKCDSCQSAQAGTSVDVFELDAASNRGIDSMRDLVAGSALGTPGERKVYIIDEVHMLSKDASTALLKTLEEPPAHVVFVLATTDTQKVLATIKSRTQHFEFRLLGPDVLTSLLHDINADAHLGVPPEALEVVVRRGRGSARDALSVLDQVAAAGEADEDESDADEIVEALCDGDTGRALTAVAGAMSRGRDPRILTTELIEYLRCCFLAIMAPGVVGLPDAALERAAEHGRRLGPAAMVRHLDLVGEALVDMREAHDPRVSLEVALVRATRPEASSDVSALVERIAKLERAVAAGVSVAPAPADPAAAAQPGAPSSPRQPRSGDAPARATKSPLPSRPPTRGATPSPAATEPPAPQPSADTAEAGGTMPDRDLLTQAWGDLILGALPNSAKSRLRTGRFTAVEGDTAVFALPNQPHVNAAESIKSQAEDALTAHFGTRVRMKLIVDDSTAPAAPAAPPRRVAPIPEEEIEEVSIEDTVPADTPSSADQVVLTAFPGAEEVETP